MNTRNKKALYESIMRSVAKEVKKALNEYYVPSTDDIMDDNGFVTYDDITPEMFYNALKKFGGYLDNDTINEICGHDIIDYATGDEIDYIRIEEDPVESCFKRDAILFKDQYHDEENIFYHSLHDDHDYELIYNYLINN